MRQVSGPVAALPVVERSEPLDGGVAQLVRCDAQPLVRCDAQPLEGGGAPLDARTREPDARNVQLGIRGVQAAARRAKGDARAAQAAALGIKELRARSKLSQSDFAALLGVELGTLRNWEQGRRVPTGPARALLRAIRNDPQNVIRALARAA